MVRQRKSCARLSTNRETDVCIVFVHGFFGNSVTTWGQFSGLCDSALLKDAAMWARSDLYFYDYGAEKDFVKRSAHGLGVFLERIFPAPDMSIFGLKPDDATKIRDPWLRYSRLVLVGHSLGAVVIRECVENRLRGSRSVLPAWAHACELHLFASAHLGFQFSGWKELLYRLAPKYFTSIPMMWRAFNDLQKKSDTLTDLRQRTEKLAPANPQVAALLMYGDMEDVVVPGEFDCDPTPMNWVDGHDHVSLCKPNPYFTEPFDFVIKNDTTRQAGA